MGFLADKVALRQVFFEYFMGSVFLLICHLEASKTSYIVQVPKISVSSDTKIKNKIGSCSVLIGPDVIDDVCMFQLMMQILGHSSVAIRCVSLHHFLHFKRGKPQNAK
jgi:hypothetical protein